VTVKPKGTPPTGIDHCAAYDPTRDCIYYYTSSGEKAEDNFFSYDIRENTWTRPRTKGSGPFHASSYESIFSYDSANDALMIVRLYDKGKPGDRRVVYLYDPRAHTWADPLPLPAEVVKSIRKGNSGFYDPDLNAYSCHFASDSSDNGTMWAYRYKKAK
jgi:hypothetical protein